MRSTPFSIIIININRITDEIRQILGDYKELEYGIHDIAARLYAYLVARWTNTKLVLNYCHRADPSGIE